MDDGEVVEIHLREISDQIVQLRNFLEVEPANGFLIELLEMERAKILREVIRVV